MPVFTYPPNIYGSYYNSSKKMAYVVGQCATATSSSGVAQYNVMIEALSNQTPYTRAWFKDMVTTYGWSTELYNSAYDETKDILYLVYGGTSPNTYLHAISGVDGSDVYPRVQITNLDISHLGAFSLSHDVFMTLNDVTGKPQIVTLSTGALTSGNAVSPLPSQSYTGAFITENGLFVKLYEDSVPNMYAFVSDVNGLASSVPIMNGVTPVAGIGTAAGYVLSAIDSNSFYMSNYGVDIGKFSF